MRPGTIWMFAGQGSQYYRMGQELFETEPAFRRSFEEGDALVRNWINLSLVDLLYRSQRDRFGSFARTLHSQPALLLVQCSLAQVLSSRGLKPDQVLGYSLGEYASLVAAGSWNLEQALKTAVIQAELLEYLAPEAAMLAILEDSRLFERQPAWFEGTTIACRNFSRSFIVVGRPPAIESCRQTLKEAAIASVGLPVSHGFHSPDLDLIADPFQRVLREIAFTEPLMPVRSASTAKPVDRNAREQLWRAVREPVAFDATMAALEQEGPWLYLDLGPSGSMATSVKYNLQPGSRSEFLSVLTPYGQDRRNLERAWKRLAQLQEDRGD